MLSLSNENVGQGLIKKTITETDAVMCDKGGNKFFISCQGRQNDNTNQKTYLVTEQ